MSLHEIALTLNDGTETTFGAFAHHAVLVVNVASKCGYTRQYDGLEALHREFRDRGLVVLGVPCNQFAGQEPGTAEEIEEFCRVNFGVTFPLAAKSDVLGKNQHPLYAALTQYPAGDDLGEKVKWNFEKFLVDPEGQVVGRFRSSVEPDSAELRSAIEAVLPAEVPAA
ncbi:glutathione peroxidase [Sinomonas atrocyanea]|uniref:glutathione peroxidase n=1 Tax=Sinomonas atrocyanea TaxID=37927 RepID=UPI00277E56F1|nr:glutathione peroxidase [Sinomonas atrocyanea]MDQ0261552.1 glutathione peroxidase [Sinomonas atrocyanea]MDR6623252.1 glutathione peroxidase [Sinomonas atrocyanea]